jgi:hypothetical protein
MVLVDLAFCLRNIDNEELHKEIRNMFNDFCVTSLDLLKFLHYYAQQGKSGKISFSRGLRNCLEKWYDKWSPSELLEILFATEKYGETSHKKILQKLHLKLENPDKNEMIQAASYMKYKDIKEAAQTSTTMKKILKYKDLKRCTEVNEVVSILKRKDYTYKLNHLPSCAMKSQVIELILPNMNLREIVDNLVEFCNHKFLRVNDQVQRKICNSLQCSNKTINDAKLNPIKVYGIMKEISKKLTCVSSEKSGEEAQAATNEKDKISNPFVIKKLYNILNQSMQERADHRTGCRFYITVDFRKFSKRQSKVNEKYLREQT